MVAFKSVNVSVFHIDFDKEKTGTQSYIGGNPAVFENESFIPKIPETNENQKLLLTLTSDFFRSPLLKENERISVFISQNKNDINTTRKLAVNMQEQIDNLNNGYSKVFFHRTVETANSLLNYLPKSYLHLSPFNDLELVQETQNPGTGTEYSKLNGLPGWLQDPINIGMKLQYWLQLNESDLIKVSTGYEDIFRGGIGYLLLNRNIKKIQSSNTPVEIGHFFIQFT